MKTICI